MSCPACFPCCQLDTLHGHLTRKSCWKHWCRGTSNWKDTDDCYRYRRRKQWNKFGYCSVRVHLGGVGADEVGKRMSCGSTWMIVPRKPKPLCCCCSAAAEKPRARDRPIAAYCGKEQNLFREYLLDIGGSSFQFGKRTSYVVRCISSSQPHLSCTSCCLITITCHKPCEHHDITRKLRALT